MSLVNRHVRRMAKHLVDMPGTSHLDRHCHVISVVRKSAEENLKRYTVRVHLHDDLNGLYWFSWTALGAGVLLGPEKGFYPYATGLVGFGVVGCRTLYGIWLHRAQTKARQYLEAVKAYERQYTSDRAMSVAKKD